MSEASSDPTVQRLRREISDVDREILRGVNTRLELVAELKRHKENLGLSFVDPDRERELLDELARANGGPLSEEGMRALFAELLELTKREVGRGT
jgi:chorismate mutase / prephenate dehydratase